MKENKFIFANSSIYTLQHKQTNMPCTLCMGYSGFIILCCIKLHLQFGATQHVRKPRSQSIEMDNE